MRRAVAALALLFCCGSAGAVPPRVPSEGQRPGESDIDYERRIQRNLRRDGVLVLPNNAPIPTPRPEQDPMPGGASGRVRQQPPPQQAQRQPPQQTVPVAGRASQDSVPLSGPQDQGALPPSGASTDAGGSDAAGSGADGGSAGSSGGSSPDAAGAGKGKTATSRVNRGLDAMKRSLGEMRADAGGLEASASATAGAALAAASAGQAASRIAAAAPPPSAAPGAAPPQSALEKRPDFFSVLPPDKLQQLKSVFASGEGPGLPSFKHLGLSPAGDFAYTRSCQRVSGDCNPRAVEPGYKKGELASPETLASVRQGVMEELDPASVAKFFAEEDAEEEAAVREWDAKQAKRGAAAAPRGVKWGTGGDPAFGRKEDAGTAVSLAGLDAGGGRSKPDFEYSAAPRARRPGARKAGDAEPPSPARGFPWLKLAFASLGAGALFAAWRWVAARDAARVELAPLGRDGD